VVSPYVIGGQRMAQAVLRPNVMDFIELATRRAGDLLITLGHRDQLERLETLARA
jgi:Trk K+ transport system NAD-binding subunit